MSVSKNQRAGVKQKPRKRYCAGASHEMTPVRMVPVFGRALMVWRCACDGYAPMTTDKKGAA